jgi:hypothetical protein
LERLIGVARWPVGLCLVALGFVGLALAVQDSAVAASVALVGGLAGMIVGVVVRGLQERRPRASDVVTFVLGGIGVFAVLHAASIQGGWAIVVAMGGLLGWVAMQLGLTRLEGRSDGAVDHVTAAATRLRDLDVAGLCALWETTNAAARGRLAPHEAAQLARVRQRLLDELERRSPGGFAAWLSQGGAGSPSRYLA